MGLHTDGYNSSISSQRCSWFKKDENNSKFSSFIV
jgi:hypothetical protein